MTHHSRLLSALVVSLALGTRLLEAAVQYGGVTLDVSQNWIQTLPAGAAYPFSYRLENGGTAQRVEVMFETERLRLKRTHQLDANEAVTGFFYVPTSRRENAYMQLYGRVGFRGSRTGQLPREEWVTASVHPNYYANQIDAPRLVLVGRAFDLTGLNAALDDRMPSGRSSYGRMNASDLYVRADHGELPTSWIGYSGALAVLLEQAEAAALSQELKSALQDYVFSGGVLLLVSPDDEWCWQWWGEHGDVTASAGRFAACYGLGSVTQLSAGPQGSSQWSEWFDRLRSWPSQTIAEVTPRENPPSLFLRRSGGRLPAWNTLLEQLDSLHIELPEFPRVSYGVLWWLMVGFVIVVGPVNYGVLKKRGRLPLFIITASAISVASGAALLLTAVLLEGFGAKAVSSSVTLLFQQDHRAISFQRLSLYSTVGLSLNYPADTLTAAMFGQESRESSGMAPYRYGETSETEGTIDFDNGVTLGGGFVPARLVRAFGSVQLRTERGRLLFSKNSKGQLEVQNGLGVGIAQLLYHNGEGRWFEAMSVGRGDMATLAAIADTEVRKRREEICFYVNNETLVAPNLTVPLNSYIALAAEPFGIPSLSRRVKVRPTKHIIVGFVGHE